MSAAFKFREVPPEPLPRGLPGRARVMSLSPVFISARPFGDGQHAEKVMGTYTRTFCVNAQKTAVKSELGVWARSEPAKILSLRTGISQSLGELAELYPDAVEQILRAK